MKSFIFVGMPASGKNIARQYAQSRGLPYFATGDLVRQEVSRRGLEPDAENTARISTELRGKDGQGVTRLVLSAALETGSPVVFLEGMRSWPEIELIRRQADAVVVAFLAPRHIRLQRILSRGRADDSPEHFQERDFREIDYGMAVPVAMADEYILNTGGVEEALRALNEIVKRRTSGGYL
jgi:dephospho-CoA kinase